MFIASMEITALEMMIPPAIIINDSESMLYCFFIRYENSIPHSDLLTTIDSRVISSVSIDARPGSSSISSNSFVARKPILQWLQITLKFAIAEDHGFSSERQTHSTRLASSGCNQYGCEAKVEKACIGLESASSQLIVAAKTACWIRCHEKLLFSLRVKRVLLYHWLRS